MRLAPISDQCDYGKSQAVRLIDVFALGPLMTWTGVVIAKEHPVAGAVMALSGAATIVYNGVNYRRIAQKRR